MLEKTVLEINKDLNKEEQIEEMCSNISVALAEIQNYKINYILYVENLSQEQKQGTMEDIKESLLEIVDFISSKEKKDDEVMLIMQENFKKAKGDREVYINLMEQYWCSKNKKQIRRFVKDYHRNEMKKISKGEHIELLELKTTGKSMEVTFNILDKTKTKIDQVTTGFNTSTFAEFWNCTTQAEEK